MNNLAGLSSHSLAGVGLSECIRCQGPGLTQLTNGDLQQQQHEQIGASHCASKTVESVDRVLGGGLKAAPRHPRAPQTCSIGLRSGDRAGLCMS
ncbi:hypothetical protein TNCV_3417181 [Trichonephila clavipes]|nr:hypothetical protein TNCV_3417181 [Trichonephila clavipes]